MADYWRCPDEIEDLARAIIEAHHAHLAAGISGVEACFLFLFRDKASTKGGKITMANVSKVSAKENAIAGASPGEELAFKIEIAFDIWQARGEAFHRALLDHELCHCSREMTEDGDVKWVIVPHDIEEFNAIIERHGAWTSDIEQFLKRTGQLDLFAADTSGGALASPAANSQAARADAGDTTDVSAAFDEEAAAETQQARSTMTEAHAKLLCDVRSGLAYERLKGSRKRIFKGLKDRGLLVVAQGQVTPSELGHNVLALLDAAVGRPTGPRSGGEIAS